MALQASIRAQIKGSGRLGKIVRSIRQAMRGPKKVKVGFPAGKSDPGIMMRAVWNEFGTSRGIPERPFLRTTMTKNHAKYRSAVTKIAKNIVNGSGTMDGELNRLGLMAQGDVQETIGSNMGPANAPATIAKKKSSKTLIDAGEMRQKVTYDVER